MSDDCDQLSIAVLLLSVKISPESWIYLQEREEICRYQHPRNAIRFLSVGEDDPIGFVSCHVFKAVICLSPVLQLEVREVTFHMIALRCPPNRHHSTRFRDSRRT